MLSVGPTSQGMQRVRRSRERPSTAPGPGGWVEDEDNTGSCACPEEVPETESREGVWPLGCSCTKGPRVCQGPDVDSQVHWARDQPPIAAAIATVGPHVHLRLCHL